MISHNNTSEDIYVTADCNIYQYDEFIMNDLYTDPGFIPMSHTVIGQYTLSHTAPIIQNQWQILPFSDINTQEHLC